MEKQELTEIKTEVRELKNCLRSLVDDVSEILMSVKGDSSLGIEGLAKKVDRHDKWINKMNLKIATVSGGASAIVWVTIKLMEHIL